jgi:hypothetical protein
MNFGNSHDYAGTNLEKEPRNGYLLLQLPQVGELHKTGECRDTDDKKALHEAEGVSPFRLSKPSVPIV